MLLNWVNDWLEKRRSERRLDRSAIMSALELYGAGQWAECSDIEKASNLPSKRFVRAMNSLIHIGVVEQHLLLCRLKKEHRDKYEKLQRFHRGARTQYRDGF